MEGGDGKRCEIWEGEFDDGSSRSTADGLPRWSLVSVPVTANTAVRSFIASISLLPLWGGGLLTLTFSGVSVGLGGHLHGQDFL